MNTGRFKYWEGNTDVRFYWEPTHRNTAPLTDEDNAILRDGCIPTVDQERQIHREHDDARMAECVQRNEFMKMVGRRYRVRE